MISFAKWRTIFVSIVQIAKYGINLFAEQDKHLSKVNTTTQIVVQVRLLLMKMKKLNLHQIISHEIRSEVRSGASEPEVFS